MHARPLQICSVADLIETLKKKKENPTPLGVITGTRRTA